MRHRRRQMSERRTVHRGDDERTSSRSILSNRRNYRLFSIIGKTRCSCCPCVDAAFDAAINVRCKATKGYEPSYNTDRNTSYYRSHRSGGSSSRERGADRGVLPAPSSRLRRHDGNAPLERWQRVRVQRDDCELRNLAARQHVAKESYPARRNRTHLSN